MATDPVQMIEEHHYPTPFATNLASVLRRLADLPPDAETPYLTVSLDWRPDGANPAKRPGRQFLSNQTDVLLTRFEPHTPAHDSLSADVKRIRDEIDERLDPAAHGIIIVARNRGNVFELLPLGVPVPNSVTTGPIPALSTLARIAEEEAAFALLLADQREATLIQISQSRRDQSLEVTGTDYPRKQQQGGWSQRRYQARADERVAAFARTVAEETRRALDDDRIEMLVVASEEPMLTALDDAFHSTVKDRIAGMIGLNPGAGAREITADARGVIEQMERAREERTVQAISDGVGAGAKGVAGADDVIAALQTGQVMTLALVDDFTCAGWADYSFPVYGVGEIPKEHPAGGGVGNIVPISLEEEMVRLAIQSAAEIEIVRTSVPVSAEEQRVIPDGGNGLPRTRAAHTLDQLGGVGAVLRFALDAGRPTVDL